MPILQPRIFPHLERCEGLSPQLVQDHYRLYTGYVAKYNELMVKLHLLYGRPSISIGSDTESLKADITYALGAIKNHEIYFGCLGQEGPEPGAELASEIISSFHSVPQYLVDLKQTALLGRGWAWTAFDLEQGHLFNYQAGAQNGLPVWTAVPILAIDLYGHAYFYDFGTNKSAYIEMVMKSLDWEHVAERLAAAKRLRGALHGPATSSK